MIGENMRCRRGFLGLVLAMLLGTLEGHACGQSLRLPAADPAVLSSADPDWLEQLTGTSSASLLTAAAEPQTARLSRSSEPCCVGFLKADSGMQIESSLVVNKGSIQVTQDAAYLMLKQSGHAGYLQAGDPASGSGVWHADLVFDLPDLAQGKSTQTSGALAGASVTTWASAVGHCMFADSHHGILEDSHIACISSILLPANTNSYGWRSGRNTAAIASAAISADSTATLPNVTGTLAFKDVAQTWNADQSNMSLVKPTITAGIVAGGSGLKHVRVAGCTTPATRFAGCTTTVNWPGTAFPDTNYTAVCTLDNPSAEPLLAGTQRKTAGSILVKLVTWTSQSSSATIDCVAVHD